MVEALVGVYLAVKIYNLDDIIITRHQAATKIPRRDATSILFASTDASQPQLIMKFILISSTGCWRGYIIPSRSIG